MDPVHNRTAPTESPRRVADAPNAHSTPKHHARSASMGAFAFTSPQITGPLFDLSDPTIEDLLRTIPKRKGTVLSIDKFYTGNEENDLLLKAASIGDLETLQEESEENLRACQDSRGKKLLHIAAIHDQPGVIEHLVGLGIDPNTNDVPHKGSFCRTPMHDAAFTGSARAVVTLLQCDGTLEGRDARGYTPLHYCAEEGHPEIIPLLCGKNIFLGIKLDKSEALGDNAVQLALKKTHPETLQALLDCTQDNEQRRVLFGKSFAEVAFEVASRKDFSECKASSLAEMAAHPKLIRTCALLRCILRVIQESGEDFYAEFDALKKRPGGSFFARILCTKLGTPPKVVRAKHGNTPLHTAAALGVLADVTSLLEKNANPLISNDQRNIALHLAAKKGHLDVCRELKSKEGLEHLNQRLEIPFFLAVTKAKHGVLDLLYREGDEKETDVDENTPLLALLEKIDLINPIFWAEDLLEPFLQDAHKTVRFLIQKGAIMSAQGSSKRTAVQLVRDNTQLTGEAWQNIKDAIVAAGLQEELERTRGLLQELTVETEEPEPPPPPPEPPPNPFVPIIERLRRPQGLDAYDNVLEDLWVDGKTVLHYIAEQPEFALYEPLLRNHHNHPLFTGLLTHITQTTGDTCVHVLCRSYNLAMLEFLLTSRIEGLREYLAYCIKVPNRLGQNGFFSLALWQEPPGLTPVQREVPHGRGTALLSLLVDICGKEESSRLASIPGKTTPESEPRAILSVAKESGNVGLMDELTKLVTRGPWEESAYK
jgi:ankyrin repeat protein